MEERFFLRFPPRLIQCCRFPLERNSLERKFETADRPQPVGRSGPDPRVTPLETSDRRSPFRPASGVDEHVPRRLRGRVDPTVDLQGATSTANRTHTTYTRFGTKIRADLVGASTSPMDTRSRDDPYGAIRNPRTRLVSVYPPQLRHGRRRNGSPH